MFPGDGMLFGGVGLLIGTESVKSVFLDSLLAQSDITLTVLLPSCVMKSDPVRTNDCVSLYSSTIVYTV